MDEAPDLTAYDDDLDEPVPVTPGDEDARTTINTYLRVMRKLERKRGRIEEEYRAERERLDARRADLVSGLEREIERRRTIVEQYAKAYKQATGHAPSQFIHGKVTMTPPRDSLAVTDLDAFIDWAEGTGRIDLVHYDKRPEKDTIKQLVKAGDPVTPADAEKDREYRAVVIASEDGEPVVVPGLAVSKPTEDSVSVKTV